MLESYHLALSDGVTGLINLLVQAAGDAAGEVADGIGQVTEGPVGELGTSENLGGNFDPLTGEISTNSAVDGAGPDGVAADGEAGEGLPGGDAQREPGFLDALLGNPLLLFGGLMLLLYVVVLSPERRKQSEIAKKRAALKKNDRVVTTGGIFGTVVAVSADSNEVTLRIDESTNTRIRVLKSAIGSVLDSGKDKPETSS